MENKNNTNDLFTSIDDITIQFSSYDISSKIFHLRKIVKNILYNEDYRKKLIDNQFLSIILTDINTLLTNHESDDIIIENNTPNDMIITYLRLFYMLFYNILSNDSIDQIKVFKYLFLTEQFEYFKTLTMKYISDLKIQKFTLGIVYKIFLLNNEILMTLLTVDHFDFVVGIFTSLKYSLSLKEIRGNRDLNDINDWFHVILKLILKDNTVIKLNGDTGTFLYLLTLNHLLFLELIRDFVDFAKDSKVLLISITNLNVFINLFLLSVQSLCEFIANIMQSYPTCEIHVITQQNPQLTSVFTAFRKFLCIVDIFSVILTTDDLNNEDYRKIIHDSFADMVIIQSLLNALSSTDVLYDTTFQRNKSLTEEEQKYYIKLDECNLFYGFQTNIMKFLSNFAYKNNHVQQFFIDNPDKFYYCLNHLKIDKCNPFKKEWTVLLIKSLSEAEYKIQSLISELKPQEMDPLLKDYIINKGAKIKLDSSSSAKEICMDVLKRKNRKTDSDDDDCDDQSKNN